MLPNVSVFTKLSGPIYVVEKSDQDLKNANQKVPSSKEVYVIGHFDIISANAPVIMIGSKVVNADARADRYRFLFTHSTAGSNAF
jgi:pectin methylesterase-like acyl-CoA thioesterase